MSYRGGPKVLRVRRNIAFCDCEQAAILKSRRKLPCFHSALRCAAKYDAQNGEEPCKKSAKLAVSSNWRSIRENWLQIIEDV